MTKPNPGDKLYVCFNGELETVTFLEQGLADHTCGAETWLCRNKEGRRIRCSIGMYLPTKRAAWEKYFEQVKNAECLARNAIFDAEQHLDRCIEEYERVEQILKDTP